MKSYRHYLAVSLAISKSKNSTFCSKFVLLSIVSCRSFGRSEYLFGAMYQNCFKFVQTSTQSTNKRIDCCPLNGMYIQCVELFMKLEIKVNAIAAAFFFLSLSLPLCAVLLLFTIDLFDFFPQFCFFFVYIFYSGWKSGTIGFNES